MSDLKLTIVEGADLGDKFAAAGGKAHQAIVREVDQGQLALLAAMKKNVRGSFETHSGDFLRSFAIEDIRDTGSEISGRAGSTAEFAEIQEEGGEIHAKNVRNLTIPLEAFMTGRGVARGSAREVISDPESFGYDGTFFSRNVLMGKHGDEVEPLFFLTPSVTLPARPFAQPALDEVAPTIEANIHSALEALLE